MAKLLSFLGRLDLHRISYRIEHVRDSVLVAVAVPGERWEVEFFEDSHVEIEIFRSSGSISTDEEILERLIAIHG
jgi:hypothetical protein